MEEYHLIITSYGEARLYETNTGEVKGLANLLSLGCQEVENQLMEAWIPVAEMGLINNLVNGVLKGTKLSPVTTDPPPQELEVKDVTDNVAALAIAFYSHKEVLDAVKYIATKVVNTDLQDFLEQLLQLDLNIDGMGFHERTFLASQSKRGSKKQKS